MQQPTMEAMQKIQELKNAVAADPDNYQLNVDLGNNYFDIGRFDLAIKYYHKAIHLNSGQPAVLIDMGVSHFNVNNYDSALVYINQALKLDPRHVQGLYNAGIVYYNLKQYDQAIAVWQKLIRYHANSREAQSAQQFIKQVEAQKTQL